MSLRGSNTTSSNFPGAKRSICKAADAPASPPPTMAILGLLASAVRSESSDLLGMHAPSRNRPILEDTKDDVLDEKTDQRDRKQARKDICDFELVLAFVDVPSEAARSGGHTEDQFCRDQRAPGKCPAQSQACEDRAGCRGNEDIPDIARASQAVISSNEAKRRRDRHKAGVRIKSHGPQNGMDDNENNAALAKSEPNQRQGQQSDGRQRIEHRDQQLERIAPNSSRYRQDGKVCCQNHRNDIPLQQQLQRKQGAFGKHPVENIPCQRVER